ncbi:MAG: hypothetical protein NCW75_13225 [Phycisphaera sp.]|nr:MAG: hypothetical protein NCW75_13225 [Phycisphaera sp.]
MIRITTIAVFALAGTALAQYEITIDVASPTLMPGESTVVTLYAGFDSSDYAMAAVQTDLLTSVGSEGWSDAMRLAPMDGPGTQDGFPSATGYDQIITGQYHIPSDFIADPTNPMGFWQATYTAPVDPAAPFDVDVATMTRDYAVYLRECCVGGASRLADLTEGSATIYVIPAPASASLLALGVLAMRRRR